MGLGGAGAGGEVLGGGGCFVTGARMCRIHAGLIDTAEHRIEDADKTGRKSHKG